METSSKGEEASSNKDANKDKKNEEAKEPELVNISVLENIGRLRLFIDQLLQIIMTATQIRYVIPWFFLPPYGEGGL